MQLPNLVIIWQTMTTQQSQKATKVGKIWFQVRSVSTSLLWPLGCDEQWTSIHCRAVPQVVESALLRWRHNGHNGVSNHQPHDCLLKRLFRRSKKTSKLCVTGLCEGNPPVGGYKGPVTRKMFPLDDVIMWDMDGITIISWQHIWPPYFLVNHPICMQNLTLCPLQRHQMSVVFLSNRLLTPLHTDIIYIIFQRPMIWKAFSGHDVILRLSITNIIAR